MASHNENVDPVTVASFGDEWQTYSQSDLSSHEQEQMFNAYFNIFPWDALTENSVGFDMGCGSGRWAKLVLPRIGKLNCIDASDEALVIAKKNLASFDNVQFFHATTQSAPIDTGSQDFGYSLGVLHHIPDTQAALKDCVKLLKSGAPFLLYLYYKFDNRPAWYRVIWKTSEVFRALINRLPRVFKSVVTDLLAITVYWPLARGSWLGEKLGLNMKSMPLHSYRNYSFFTMRTDSRDRFGTPLEQRFTREEITVMMKKSGLKDIKFSEEPSYWTAVGYKT